MFQRVEDLFCQTVRYTRYFSNFFDAGFLQALQTACDDLPLGCIDEWRLNRRGRHGALAHLRHGTRNDGRLFDPRGS